jgi:hypothetical protein
VEIREQLTHWKDRICSLKLFTFCSSVFLFPCLEQTTTGEMAEATPMMVFVYDTLKRGFPNHQLFTASAPPFVGAASTASPTSVVICP